MKVKVLLKLENPLRIEHVHTFNGLTERQVEELKRLIRRISFEGS